MTLIYYYVESDVFAEDVTNRAFCTQATAALAHQAQLLMLLMPLEHGAQLRGWSKSSLLSKMFYRDKGDALDSRERPACA
jgi:hypothetical protein